MADVKFTTCDDTSQRREEEYQGRRRDWRRWWDDKAEALDPDRWKAMASDLLGMLQDAASGARAEQGSPKATKSCPYLAADRLRPRHHLHRRRPRSRRLCDPDAHHPRPPV
jgi:hypothetical protein